MTQSKAAVKRKVARTADALEKIYGMPKTARPRKVLDSLIGCILSQNTNDLNSGRAWRSLKKAFPTWEKAARAPVSKIEAAIRVGGLAPSKSRRIKTILADLKRVHGKYELEFLKNSNDTQGFKYLMKIHGVGKKTAAVVLLFACGRDVFPVDTHIHRICQRLGAVPEGTTRDGVFEAMRDLVGKGKAHSFHVNMIQFGKHRCRKRNPVCKGCPLRRRCLRVKGEVTF